VDYGRISAKVAEGVEQLDARRRQVVDAVRRGELLRDPLQKGPRAGGLGNLERSTPVEPGVLPQELDGLRWRSTVASMA